MLVWAYVHRIRDALQAGDVARADADLDRARASRARPAGRTRGGDAVAEAGRAAFAGRLDEADDLTEEALAINRRHGDDCFQEHTSERLVLARLRWRPHEADLTQLRGFAARYPHLPVWEAMLAALEWDLCNADAARRGVAVCARDDFAAVATRPISCPPPSASPTPPRCRRAWQVDRLYELLLPHAAANPVLMYLWGAWGPVARGWACWRRPTTAPATPPSTSPRRCGCATSAGLRRGRCGRSATGSRPASPRRIGPSSSTAGSRSRTTLGLPGVAARIADKAQTITP